MSLGRDVQSARVLALAIMLCSAAACSAVFGFDHSVRAGACATNADCAPDQTCGCGSCVGRDRPSPCAPDDGGPVEAATSRLADALAGDAEAFVCPTGFVAACPGSDAGSCQDVRSDPENCGGCGRACGPSTLCERAQCLDRDTFGGSDPTCTWYANLDADILYAFHLQATSDAWVEKLGIETTPPAGTELTLGLYSDNGGMPNALLAEASLTTGNGPPPDAATTGTPIAAFTNSVAVPLGSVELTGGQWYFLAVLVRPRDGRLGVVACADQTNSAPWYVANPPLDSDGGLPDAMVVFPPPYFGVRPHVFIDVARISTIDQ